MIPELSIVFVLFTACNTLYAAILMGIAVSAAAVGCPSQLRRVHESKRFLPA